MSDLLVAGLAYLDIFVPAHTRPQPGQECFVDGIGLGFGGAFNTASVAAALGLKVTLCAPVGRGIADLAATELARRLGMTLCALPARDNPAISLVFSDPLERAFLSTAQFDALDRVERLPAARWVHVPGLEEAARLGPALARARADGARISVCASWNPQRLAQLAQLRDCPWDLLVLNQAEALAACAGADVRAVPAMLAGAARSIIVTQGAAGAFGVLEGQSLQVPACPTQVLDTTGAGDAFCAGLLAALARAAAPAQALGHAAAAAAFILKQRGGLLDDPAQMAAMAREMQWTP